MSRSLTIYDTDYLNPYGRELAAQLDHCLAVRYIGCRAMHWRPGLADARFNVRQSVDGSSRVRVARSSFVRALEASLRALRGDSLIVLWPRTLLEAIPFGIAGLVTKRVWFTLHNPHPRTGQPAKVRLSQLVLRKTCRLLVHSDRLLALLPARERGRARVVEHPPYLNYLKGAGELTRRERGGKRTVLFLGQLRPDKSPEELLTIVSALPNVDEVKLLFCGKGDLGPLGGQLAQRIEIDDRTDPKGVDDRALVSALSEADVMCAPYREATQSGSIILALTAGLEVVAYDSGAIADFGDWITLVPAGDAVAMAQAVSKGNATAELDDQGIEGRVRQWSNRAKTSWLRALET